MRPRPPGALAIGIVALFVISVVVSFSSLPPPSVLGNGSPSLSRSPDSTGGSTLGERLAIAPNGIPPLNAQLPLPPSPAIDWGQSVTLTAAAGGGVAPYTYSWYFADSLVDGTCPEDTDSYVGGNSVTYTAAGYGTAYYCYEVSDSENPIVSVESPGDLVTTNYAMTPGAPTPSSVTIDSGQFAIVTATPSGGTLPYLFEWEDYVPGSPAGSCLTDGTPITTLGYASSLRVLPTVTTEYCYEVKDSSVGTPPTPLAASTGEATVYVNPALVAGDLAPSSPTIDQGQSVTLTASPTGGTEPYTAYGWLEAPASVGCWSGNGTGIPSATGLTYVASPTVNTSYCFSVTDSAPSPDVADSPQDIVTVNPVLGADPVTPSAPTIESGQSVTLNANPSGGTPLYSFQWYAGSSATFPCGPPVPGATNPIYQVSPSTSTYYCYAVTDSSTGTPTAVADSAVDYLTVLPALTAGPLTPASPVIDTGQSITLAADPSGGTGAGSYGYQWYASVTPGGCSGYAPITDATSSAYVASPTESTSYCYVVTDALSNSVASGVDLVTVNPALTANPVTPNAPTIDRGSSETLTANPSSGTPLYHYQWYSGLSPSCSRDRAISGATKSTYVASPSNDTYYCYAVTDSSSGSPPVALMSGTDLVTVTSLPLLLGLPYGEGLALIGGVLGAAVIAAVAGVLVRRRRGRRTGGPSARSPPGEGPGLTPAEAPPPPPGLA